MMLHVEVTIYRNTLMARKKKKKKKKMLLFRIILNVSGQRKVILALKLHVSRILLFFDIIADETGLLKL